MADHPVLSLQSKDRKLLMDIIDKLRSTGISKHVDLPQIVVCGDQSSGKSSVLQAISGMSFPIKDGLGTRFATELILRHVPDESPETCRVSIQPGNDRSLEDRKRLEAFQYSKIPEESDIGAIIEEAKIVMGLNEKLSDQTKTLSSDVLRIELSGPAQPHLTIVDLPGLYRAGNKEQSAESARIVRSQVYSYIKNPRSIILAVISAKSESVLQDITELTRQVDPRGQRTMGLITKPDTLDAGSEEERKYFEMAQNNDIVFRLGWHVVRNRDFQARDSTNEERNQVERDFFEQGIWLALTHKDKGAAALQVRLSEVLTDHILDQLEDLLDDIEKGIDDCAGRLEKLGDSRGTIKDQRKYLVTASHRFSNLVQQAVDGVYRDKFFGDARVDRDYNKRLRAVVQNTLSDFSNEIGSRGEARAIVERAYNGPPYRNHIRRSDYLEEVRTLMRRTKGRELPGTFNPLIISDLFQKQCAPWRNILDSCCQKILDAARISVNGALSDVADEDTRTGLWAESIRPALEKLGEHMKEKISEILKPHESGHPITYNHYFTENFQKIQAGRQRMRLAERLEKFETDRYGNISGNKDAILNALSAQTEPDMELLACSTATDMMEAYYKVALKDVVHDFDTLVVEECLVSQLPKLWTPEMVLDQPDDAVHRIAGEREWSKAERKTLNEKLGILVNGRKDLKRLSEQHHSLFNRRPQQANGSISSPRDQSSGPSQIGTEDEMPDEVPEEAHPDPDEEPSVGRIEQAPAYPSNPLSPVPREEPAEPTAPPTAVYEDAEPTPIPEATPSFGIPSPMWHSGTKKKGKATRGNIWP
ncbi:P-loop containing nucleoside triphosphate hydrolase protein [Xylaria sp. FL0933]|nr:P-loop containing nucleoside triphosphate hydrolase protein [Xylaria sp. FL0933]